jgi:hypothetical protein
MIRAARAEGWPIAKTATAVVERARVTTGMITAKLVSFTRLSAAC